VLASLQSAEFYSATTLGTREGFACRVLLNLMSLQCWYYQEWRENGGDSNVAVAVVVIWHIDCVGRGGGNGCYNKKEGEQPIEALYGQNNYNESFAISGYCLSLRKVNTQRDTNTGTSEKVISPENTPFKGTAVESHGFKAPLVGVQHFKSHQSRAHAIKCIKTFREARKRVPALPSAFSLYLYGKIYFRQL